MIEIKIILISFLMLSIVCGCSSIEFSQSVKKTDSDTFIEECKFGKADESHFTYHNIKPSIIFIYSNDVKNCRKQSQIYSQIAELYSDQIEFWAIEYKNASSVLVYFPPVHKLPVYLYINQNIAQYFTLDHNSIQDMQNNINQAFSITPTQKY